MEGFIVISKKNIARGSYDKNDFMYAQEQEYRLLKLIPGKV